MRSVFLTTPGNFGKTISKLADELVKANVAAARSAFYMAAQMGKTEVVQQIAATVPYQPVDTGHLRGSFVVKRLAIGAELYSTAPHAAYIEFGTRPHWVPLDVLRAWASRKMRGGKGILSMFSAKGKRRASVRASITDKAREVEAFARGVQRKIAARGTEGRHFYARASQRFPEFVHRALLWELGKVAARGLKRGLR